ncbi:erythromycin esterase family protein [Peptoniphilus equinus]|uniref:Erythromycin esterase family protein n=1 Tax=Peptoniphilus equinus TaxID=3016343 RepID=A0ABY7QTC5_9FIRM|nr:erythromycin esterase family protein [Peptoniphilus equinus]WBW50047.1 erythromycin esterase family protein [Peptoniphilus equinus]
MRLGKIILKGLGILILIAILTMMGFLIYANRKALAIDMPHTAKTVATMQEEGQHLSAIADHPGVRLFGLGEMTHGNHRAQTLRLDMIQTLAEHGVRYIFLETPYKDGYAIERYIQGDDTTPLKDIVDAQDFWLYHTEEMVTLYRWMRTYNDTHSDKLHVYGVDMQEFDSAAAILVHKLKAMAVDTGAIQSALEKGDKAAAVEAMTSALTTADVTTQSRFDSTDLKLNLAVLKQYVTNETLTAQTQPGQVYSEDAYTFRDKSMAENTLLVLSHGRGLILAHDMHIAKLSNLNPTMGKILTQSLGDGYYAVGTFARDLRFYAMDAFIHTGSPKVWHIIDHSDMMSAFHDTALSEAYYDFDALSHPLKQYFNAVHPLLTAGATYHTVLRFLPQSNYISLNPTDAFDGLILLQTDTPFYYLDSEK